MHAPHMLPASSPTSPPAPKPAAPRSAPPGKLGHKPGEDAGGGMKVLTYLRLHWLMILFCGTLLGGAGAFAAWELLASKYESYALLQVSSVPAVIASGGNREQARTDFVTYLKTTSALLKSEFVLNAALRDIKDCPTIKAQKDPIKFLDEELVVTWQDGSEVVRITFKSHEPADAKRIVDAVLNAFLKEVVQKDVQEKRALLGKIEESQVKMREILTQKVGEKPGPVKTPPTGAPGLGGDVVPVGAPVAPAPAPGVAAPLPPVAPGVPPAVIPPGNGPVVPP